MAEVYEMNDLKEPNMNDSVSDEGDYHSQSSGAPSSQSGSENDSTTGSIDPFNENSPTQKGEMSPMRKLIVGTGQVLRLPGVFAAIDKNTCDSASVSNSESQYYHSGRSHQSLVDDDYYFSDGSGQSYFNAKIRMDSQSDLSFKDAASDISYDDEGQPAYAVSEVGCERPFDGSLGLGAVSSFGDKKQQMRPRRNGKNEIDFLTDEKRMMTYGRRIANYLAKRYAWYNPQLKQEKEKDQNDETDAMLQTSNIDAVENGKEKNQKPQPSIEKAWAYFEHTTLPRRSYTPVHEREENPEGMKKSFLEKNFNWNKTLERANPGEDSYETKLYSVWTTPLNQMGDFGLGVGLYFATLVASAILMILAGLMNVPNMMYFQSDDYSKGQEDVSWFLKGSAVCNLHEFVPCIDCDEALFADKRRIVTVPDENNETEQTFAIINDCNGATWRVGMVNFGTTLLFLVGFIIMRWYLSSMEVRFDEDEQTAQDYSIVVRNPPDSATDPETWRSFFMENFSGTHVTCCTVAVDNDDLVHALVKRRELLNAIQTSLPEEDDFSIENLEKLSEEIVSKRNVLQRLMAKLFPGLPAKVQSLVELNTEIVELSSKSYPASSVFVTFENEKAQRWVLETMNIAEVDAVRQNRGAVKEPRFLFEGEHVLFVQEPTEPSTIRWQDLHVTLFEQITKFLTTGFVFGLLTATYFVIRALHNVNTTFSAFAISISNSIFPTLAKILSKFEKHANEERREVWLYIKIAIFRCINAVVFILLITPYTSTILGGSSDLLAGVYKVFFAEIVTASVLQILDIGGNLARHFFAPRQKTQEDMDLKMIGTEVFLSERYTNMTKLIFLAVWYCPIFPAVLFFCALALGINFFVDRFSLMRTWKPSPKLGRSMSGLQRDFTFPIMVIVMAYWAVRSWSNFKYDHLCESPNTANFAANFVLPNVTDFNINEEMVFELNSDTTMYKYCANNEDMTNEQERLTFTYQLFTWSLTGLVGFIIFCIVVYHARKFYVPNYSSCGEAQDESFSNVKSRVGYIPQAKSDYFAYPFLICPLVNLEESDLIAWEDPNKEYHEYDLTEDAKQLIRESGKDVDSRLATFSKCVWFPPPEEEESKEN